MIGTSYVVCSEIWNLIQVRIIDAPEILEEALADELKRNKMTFSKFVICAKPEHLLWALLLLKNYGTEQVNIRLIGGKDAKTFCKWSWSLVTCISALKNSVVSFLILLILTYLMEQIIISFIFASTALLPDYLEESLS